MIANILAIAGSDPSGGAGIQADLKTIAACGGYGMAVLTALTAQNTRGVQAIHAVPDAVVAAQVRSVLDDIQVDAIKIGMVGTAAVVEALVGLLAHIPSVPIVLDPVLKATSGDALGDAGVVAALRGAFLARATLITPNAMEAAQLTGLEVPHDVASLTAAGHALLAQGAQAVLVKGGDLSGPESCDVLVTPSGVEVFSAPRVPTRNSHGTGCTLSSAIATHLGQGLALVPAIAAAKAYVTGALRHADDLQVGSGLGHGPLHHFWPRGAKV